MRFRYGGVCEQHRRVLEEVSAAERAQAKQRRRFHRRNRWDLLLRVSGIIALLTAASLTILVITAIMWKAVPAFFQHQIRLEVSIDVPNSDLQNNDTKDAALLLANFGQFIGEALQERFPDVTSEEDRRDLRAFVSPSARVELRDTLLENPDWVGTRQTFWLPVNHDLERYLRNKHDTLVEPRLNENMRLWVQALEDKEDIRRTFRKAFFKRGDSRRPQAVGFLGAFVGSVLTLSVTIALAFPIGVASAIYLEAFAPKSRLVDVIEVNINNLAAVPSILFGLLGLAVFINTFHLPRATPLVGGMTLALMTLPTIIITSRAAIASVPSELRAAALSVGASPVQAVFHHILPQAIPGIMTGTILAMAQALGETAPLLMIGMLAFIVDIPSDITDVATALPAQIFLWAENPKDAFSENAAASIVVLLCLLLLFNTLAIYLRNRFHTKL